jgi:hypothetical protein
VIIEHISWTIDLAVASNEINSPEGLTTFEFAYYMWAGQYGITSLSRNRQNNIVDESIKYKFFLSATA